MYGKSKKGYHAMPDGSMMKGAKHGGSQPAAALAVAKAAAKKKGKK